MAAIAAELRAERARRRVPQTTIARAIGRGQSYVSDRLNGNAALTLDEFVLVCDALGIPADELLRNVLAKNPRTVDGNDTPGGGTGGTPFLALAADEDASYLQEDDDTAYEQA